MSDTAVFAAVRDILIARTGKGLTQPEVDKINAAMNKTITAALPVKTGMMLSLKGREFIESFESYRATTYPDPGSKDGKPVTGGWGTTRDQFGKPFKLGFTGSLEYWKLLKERDLAEFGTGLNMLLQGRPTTQYQFDALFSCAYNIGLDIDDDTIAEGLGDSTLLRKHLAGDYAGAQAAFASWNKNDGKVLNGLVRRRTAEAAMYGGVYP